MSEIFEKLWILSSIFLQSHFSPKRQAWLDPPRDQIKYFLVLKSFGSGKQTITCCVGFIVVPKRETFITHTDLKLQHVLLRYNQLIFPQHFNLNLFTFVAVILLKVLIFFRCGNLMYQECQNCNLSWHASVVTFIFLQLNLHEISIKSSVNSFSLEVNCRFQMQRNLSSSSELESWVMKSGKSAFDCKISRCFCSSLTKTIDSNSSVKVWIGGVMIPNVSLMEQCLKGSWVDYAKRSNLT